MLYVLDENDTKILNEDGKPIEYTVDYIKTDDWYKHYEGIHINKDGNIDTENKQIIIPEGIDDNHAVCKKQLDQLNKNIKQYIDNELRILQNSITSSINNLKSQMLDTASKPNSK